MVHHAIEHKVRWSEVDPAGIVFYPRYFEMFDGSTTAMYRVVGVPIVESGARFTSPVRYGDHVRIRSTVTEVKDKTFRVEHEVSVGERPCARGFEVRAWVPRHEEPGGALAAAPFPEDIAVRLKGQGGTYA